MHYISRITQVQYRLATNIDFMSRKEQHIHIYGQLEQIENFLEMLIIDDQFVKERTNAVAKKNTKVSFKVDLLKLKKN